MADFLASSLPVSTWLLESQLAGGLGETTFPLSLTPSTPYLLPVPSVMAGGTWSDPLLTNTTLLLPNPPPSPKTTHPKLSVGRMWTCPIS